MDALGLLKTKEYREARIKINYWKGSLLNSNNNETKRILDEKVEFFQQMRETNPQMYSIFQTDDKEMGEMIYQKLTGRSIIID